MNTPRVSEIWIEAEQWAEGEWNQEDDNSDVIVTFATGEMWVASFFPYSNIQTLTEENKGTGECLGGTYLWASDMILVEELSRSRIEAVIDDLLSEDEFREVFDRIEEE